MKKSLILIALLLCTRVASVNAQKEWDPAPFKHLAVGVGMSTAGADFELATTLGHHFQLRAGVSALPYTLSTSLDLGLGEVFQEVDPMVLSQAGVDPNAISSEADVTAGLGLMNGKVLVDIYPFKKAGIHLTAGAYFGSDNLLTVGVEMPDDFVDAVESVRDVDPDFDFDNEFIEEGAIDLSITTRKVKPYLGLGLSRAVPKRRLSLNVDCGVMFHGTPDFKSSADDIEDMLDDNEVTDIMEKLIVYPVISFRLVGRIF